MAAPEHRAELLGAVFGDGYIQQRGERSWKVAVTVSDKYPAWLARVKELFTLVYGGYHEYCKYEAGHESEFSFYEVYWTTHDVIGDFGVSHKYVDANSDGQMLSPPSWVDEDAECERLFLKSLFETDGWFVSETDRRWGTTTAGCGFAQKPGVLIGWVYRVLKRNGYAVRISAPPSQPEMNYVIVDRQAHIARLGEWLVSIKWQSLLASGFVPKVGRRSAGGTAKFWVGGRSGITLEAQKEWRRLRAEGASIGAIATYYGRSNSVVHTVVRDIVPAMSRTAEELGLVRGASVRCEPKAA